MDFITDEDILMAIDKSTDRFTICFGEALWDQLPSGRLPGGAPMNVAYHLRQLGIPALMATRLGNDDAGVELKSFLQKMSLDSPLIQEDEKLPTCEVQVFQKPDGDMGYHIPYPVSWDSILPDQALLEAAERAKVLVFGSLSGRDRTSRETLLRLLSHTNALKVFDVNLRPPHYKADQIVALMKRADIIKMNASECGIICRHLQINETPEQALPQLQEMFGCQAVCITRGAEGAVLYHRETLVQQPQIPVKVADTVGAGDAFLAGFIYKWLHRAEAAEILHFATRIGSYVAGRPGACPVYEDGFLRQLPADKS